MLIKKANQTNKPKKPSQNNPSPIFLKLSILTFKYWNDALLFSIIIFTEHRVTTDVAKSYVSPNIRLQFYTNNGVFALKKILLHWQTNFLLKVSFFNYFLCNFRATSPWY